MPNVLRIPSRAGARSRRGVALVTTLFLIVVMLILIGALLDFLPEELREVSYTGFDNRALYVADSGIQAAIVKIEEQSPAVFNGPLNESFPPEPDGSTAKYTVSVKGMKYINNLRSYWLDSVGLSPQGQRRHVAALVSEQSFAYWNYLGKNNAVGNFFVAGLMQFNGPVYLEGQSSAAPVNLQWYPNVASLFLDNVTVAGSYQWYDQNGNQNAPTGTNWNSVDAQGQPGVAFKPNNTVPFPPETSSTLVANEAYAGNPGNGAMPAPPSNGVYINKTASDALSGGNLTTGVYVQGDANVALAASPAGVSPSTQTFTFTPAGGGNSIPDPVTVTVNFTTNKTTVVTGSDTVTLNGVPSGEGGNGSSANGAVFVNGNIKSLAGSVNGDYTIAVPDMGSLAKSITVTGNITYHQDPKSCNCNSSDLLGLFANDVKMSGSIPGAVTVEAAVFAGNRTEVQNKSTDGTFETDFDPCTGNAKGNLQIYGSMVNNYVSALGCYNPSTGQLVHGWADTYVWDTRFKTQAPPFYPRSPQYTIIAWNDLGVQ